MPVVLRFFYFNFCIARLCIWPTIRRCKYKEYINQYDWWSSTWKFETIIHNMEWEQLDVTKLAAVITDHYKLLTWLHSSCRWRYYLECTLARNAQITLKKFWGIILSSSCPTCCSNRKKTFIIPGRSQSLAIIALQLEFYEEMLSYIWYPLLHSETHKHKPSPQWECYVHIINNTNTKHPPIWGRNFCIIPNLWVNLWYMFDRTNPVQAGSHAEFSQWLCHAHNVVNRR